MRGQRFNSAGPAPAQLSGPVIGALPVAIVGGDTDGGGRSTLATLALVGAAVATGYALRGSSRTARAVRSDARAARTLARRSYHKLAARIR